MLTFLEAAEVLLLFPPLMTRSRISKAGKRFTWTFQGALRKLDAGGDVSRENSYRDEKGADEH